MRLSFSTTKQPETIEQIMSPINAIVAKLKAFRERALANAEVAEEDAVIAQHQAKLLRDDAAEAERQIQKYA